MKSYLSSEKDWPNRTGVKKNHKLMKERAPNKRETVWSKTFEESLT
jgi:hypothetical protein